MGPSPPRADRLWAAAVEATYGSRPRAACTSRCRCARRFRVRASRQGIVFTVPRLDVLKRSGRLGARRRAVAGKLDCYVIMMLDQGGIRDVDVAHGTTAVARSLVKQVPEGARDGLLIVTGYGNSAATGAVVECIQRRLPQAEVSVRDGGPVVSLHLGVGSVSLAWDVPRE